MEQQMSTGTISVLVVDDNSANVFVLATMLRQMGFDVDEAGSGMEAVNNTCKKNYDLILMDHIMPKMSGIEAIKQILFIGKGKKLPKIIGVSATLEPDVIEAFESAGVSEVIPKPVKRGDFIEKLQRLGIPMPNEAGEEEKTKDDIVTILSEVQGLDFRKGIELMAGSGENYMRVLDVCVKNIAENYTAVESIRKSSQMENFALHFHSLKGIFLNIGADTIAEFSKEMEMSAREGNIAFIHEKVDAYLEQVQQISVQLKRANDKYSEQCQSVSGSETVSDSELAQLLEKLKQHIEDFEYIEITEVLDKLLQTTSDGIRQEIEKISGAVQSFDYDGALDITNALQKSL